MQLGNHAEIQLCLCMQALPVIVVQNLQISISVYLRKHQRSLQRFQRIRAKHRYT
jgi:hypothetical protein